MTTVKDIYTTANLEILRNEVAIHRSRFNHLNEMLDRYAARQSIGSNWDGMVPIGLVRRWMLDTMDGAFDDLG